MITRILLGAAILAASVSSASAATITNGSFESPIQGGSFGTLVGTALTGWTIGGSIDLINSYWFPTDGNQSIDLNGGQQGSIFQNIAGLIAGARYLISFDLSGNPDGAPVTKTVLLSAGNENGTFTATPGGRPNIGYTSYTFNFVADGTNDLLTFASQDAGFYGAALDNVTIAAIPVPAGLPLLLAGLGSLAAIRRRRKV